MSVANRAQSEPKLLLGVTLTDHFEADLGDGLLNGFGCDGSFVGVNDVTGKQVDTYVFRA